jgi:hypothetical protein
MTEVAYLDLDLDLRIYYFNNFIGPTNLDAKLVDLI